VFHKAQDRICPWEVGTVHSHGVFIKIDRQWDLDSQTEPPSGLGDT
jgi:hypothetical protein